MEAVKPFTYYRLEKLAITKMTEKSKNIGLASAKKIIEELEKEN